MLMSAFSVRCVALLGSARLCFSAVVGELDEERDLAIDYSAVRAEPLKPVVH